MFAAPVKEGLPRTKISSSWSRRRAWLSRPAGGTGPCRAAAFALALVGAWPQAAAAATITVTAERRGDTIEIKAGALLDADATTAWLVLTDYDRYREFIPDLRESRVVARRGATVIVEQSGDAKLWLLPIPLRMTFEKIGRAHV